VKEKQDIFKHQPIQRYKGHYTFFIAKLIITAVFFFITAGSNMHCADNILFITENQIEKSYLNSWKTS
jgi:hypothetical protein